MPARVTVLFPFLTPSAINPPVLSRLRATVGRHPPFRVRFRSTGAFPGVLYLAPEPSDAFRYLTLAVWAAFPHAPPYGGAHAEVTPHLTVGYFADAAELGAVARDLQTRLAETPVEAEIGSVTLFDNESGGWVARQSLALGEG